jgi:RsiW-degrading membrane proteinase PrsW (M82 family)
MFFFAYIVYWADRYEKEPKLLLGAVFIWGAIVAAAGAFIINTVLGLGVYMFTGSELATELTTGSLIAPVIEESFKGLAVMLIFLVFRREFDSVMDGIVYAAVCALGFAATENAYYLYSYGFTESGLGGIVELFIIRVLLVGWQHPFYTSFIGVGLAFSRLSTNTAVKLLAPITGWGFAVTAHALHNTLASLVSGLGGLAIVTLFDWSGWIVMFLFIVWALYRERRNLLDHLREEVGTGVISAAHYKTACSAILVSLARLNALFSGSFHQTARFYQLTAELAHKKQQRHILGEEYGNSAIIDQLRTELSSLGPRAVV